MSDPEPDEIFRARLLRVVHPIDRATVLVGIGPQLDRIGVRYDRFRTGVPLKGLEGAGQSKLTLLHPRPVHPR